MININSSFKANFSLGDDLVAYIDEAGDDGFKDKCSEWFVVSAIVTSFGTANQMAEELKTYSINANKRLNKMSFKDLSHPRRKEILAKLSKYKYLSTSSVFYKPQIQKSDVSTTYPSMYFVGIKNVIERLSWITDQYDKRRVHVLISNRNSIPRDNLKTYLFTNSINAEKNLTYQNKIGNVSLSNINNHPKLILGDYAASSLFQCLEKTTDLRIGDSIYFDLLLKGKMYSSSHSKYGGVWRNGLKCSPDLKELIEYGGILEEGSHNF